MFENAVIQLQQNHRSIREFTGAPVEEEKRQALYDVFCKTPSSMGLQQCSIVRVRDAEKRKKIAEWGNQEYIARAPELWIYVVDTYRNGQIAQEKGTSGQSDRSMDFFFQGFTDAILAAQNVNVAVESMGMGGCFIGNILNNPQGLCALLELPAGVFPALGYIFGYPNQKPEKKPRMEASLRVFEDSYQKQESYLEALAEYDEVMHTYYDLRQANRRVDRFTDQVAAKVGAVSKSRQSILQFVREQGFALFAEEEAPDA
uniref:NADPH-dependent oxidoreductase n=1 Tax=Ndongobacter massiliensis TaxID=1871025 RepID=UPI0009310011|nr:NADPH-dependent oxidoreductase [Ndongobacter massiliensis]